VIGRAEEEAQVERLVVRARGGSSGALVVRGEPGIGKTALLDYARSLAEECTVIHVVGVESELELPFAALNRVVLPLRDELAELPAAQRMALEWAFGTAPATPPSLLVVGLAALSLLARAAVFKPLVCIVDDAQWIDRPSLASLAFVARRLGEEGVVLLFGLRDGQSPRAVLEGIAELRLSRLDLASAHELLADRGLRHDAVRRLVDETGGNPLALLELAKEPEPSTDRWPARLPLTPRLEALFTHQAGLLPRDAQTFLLLAAAEPACDVETLLRAAGHLGLGSEATAAAQAAGLLALGATATFRHPLVRSAVYGAALEADRRRAHEALALAFDERSEPDRRAWHRAVAAIAPDDSAADELERSAARTRARGGYVSEGAALERAAALTADPQRRAHRLLAAAVAAEASGDSLRVLGLLDQAESLLKDPVLAAQAQLTRGSALPNLGRISEVPRMLADTARELEDLDVRLARNTWLEALKYAITAREEITGTTLEAVARGARAAPSAEHPTLIDLLLNAFADRVLDGPVSAAPAMREIVDALGAGDHPGDVRPHLSIFGTFAARELMEHDGLYVVLRRLERVERRDDSKWLRGVLLTLADCAWAAGEPDAADAYYLEATEMRMSQTARFELVQGDNAQWLAWQGAEDEARAAAEALFVIGRDFGKTISADFARCSLAVLENSLGRCEAALGHARPLFDADPIPVGGLILPEVVEAALRSGHRDLAEAASVRLAERSRADPTPRSLALSARCAAQLAEGDVADELYRQALTHIAATSAKTDRARTHLLYGEWLRRQRRRQDAREHLRLAHEQFASMRCRTFAERARVELAATGEHVRARTFHSSDALTPQEAQIARFAARRATNGEIAAQLFISESTVAYHLRKVFRKLGVRSRRELGDALDAAPPTGGIA
jgi:DNA-binding CsgD family transcriptional regulator/tetratricopeptide (TPR) repeat protein